SHGTHAHAAADIHPGDDRRHAAELLPVCDGRHADPRHHVAGADHFLAVGRPPVAARRHSPALRLAHAAAGEGARKWKGGRVGSSCSIGGLIVARPILAFALIVFAVPTFAREPAAERDAVIKVLTDQEAAWNRGDLRGFMEGYWNSPELSFYSGRD